nr:Chain A, CLAVATA3/ESR (CLE)-related protein 44 [Arabidopsis thaliana]
HEVPSGPNPISN